MSDGAPDPIAPASVGTEGMRLVETANEFEASLIVAVLADSGIDAVVGPPSIAPLSAALRGEVPTTPVLVRRDDLTAARRALAGMQAASSMDEAFDGDEEVLDRDEAPAKLRSRRGRSMLASAPVLAIIGWVVAAGIILLMAAAAVVALLT